MKFLNIKNFFFLIYFKEKAIIFRKCLNLLKGSVPKQ